jgi:hypothetical protein
MMKPSTTGLAPGVLANLGGRFGNWLGGPSVGAVGHGIGNIIGKITGMGSYQIKQNSLSGNTQIPAFSKIADGMMVSHREYCFDVLSGPNYETSSTTGTAFNCQSLLLTPTNLRLTPLLAQLAYYFQEFEILGLVFEFKSTSADALNSTNTALGTVMMATNYDPQEPPFSGKTELETYTLAVSCKPSESMLHMVECAPQFNPLSHFYGYNSASLGTIDTTRFSALGRLNIATYGMQKTNVNLGELWVTYHVKLNKPRLILSSNSSYFATFMTPNNSSANLNCFVGYSPGPPLTLWATSGVPVATIPIAVGGMLSSAGPSGSVFQTTGSVTSLEIAPVFSLFTNPNVAYPPGGAVANVNFPKPGFYKVCVNMYCSSGFALTGTAGAQQYAYVQPTPLWGAKLVNTFNLNSSNAYNNAFESNQLWAAIVTPYIGNPAQNITCTTCCFIPEADDAGDIPQIQFSWFCPFSTGTITVTSSIEYTVEVYSMSDLRNPVQSLVTATGIQQTNGYLLADKLAALEKAVEKLSIDEVVVTKAS